jgi:hypothetical protein
MENRPDNPGQPANQKDDDASHDEFFMRTFLLL